MSEVQMRSGSLVLYKGRPACVRRVGKKLQIKLGGGETLQVRPKDVVLLHPGPVESVDDLGIPTGEVETAFLYDLYEGAQVGEGRKSLTYELAFRAADRTLTDPQVDEVVTRIKSSLGKLDVHLRT